MPNCISSTTEHVLLLDVEKMLFFEFNGKKKRKREKKKKMMRNSRYLA